MLQRTVSSSSLLRLLGGGFLLYGLYVIVLALTASDSVPYARPMVFQDAMAVENFLFYGGLFPGNPIVPSLYRSVDPLGVLTPGPLLWVGLGILCVSLTLRRVQAAYVGLQLALWLISVAVWSPILWLLGSNEYGLGAVGPFFLVTLALSLILVALYKPVTHRLTQLASPSV
ncbi:MAG TPA: hypothetical protein VGR57_02085 [Ktedonobacterales bacterium]|nr:hypothetical protein [Ktedonobacterales bacterium]